MFAYLKRLILLTILWQFLLPGALANSPRPVTPGASDEAKALLNYIYSIKGYKVLSGQQGLTEVDYVNNITGRYPAVKGHDLIHEKENKAVVESIIDWWNRGGIPTLMWHWGAPGKGEGYENSKKEIDIDLCFKEGTVENKAMWDDLHRVADWLTILRDAKVPVIWRPMHECEGDWFWYGKGTGQQFNRLWRTMFEYFTKERKLNNLIWVLCHTGEPTAEYDPGEGYYDIVGADSYSKERVRKEMYSCVRLIHGDEYPVVYHECGTIPDPDECFAEGVDWIWWMLWSREYATGHDKEILKNVYNHERVLTLDELPPIMSYLPDTPNVYNSSEEGGYPLVADGRCADIYFDEKDFPVVGITAEMFADDVERVSGNKPVVKKINSISKISGRPAVIAGTIGKNRVIDNLIKKGLIEVSDIKGKWESFVITTIDHPEYNIPLLIIAGSDRRGTAFGLTTMSEAIGVSPWYWWADVIPERKSTLYVEPGFYRQGEPSVQYRGIFINDERFGGWAKWVENHFDKESGKVGPKIYEKVFELLLRLKGNYLWPAMHPGTQAFNADPENARIADQYAIVMGSSHCEQMLRNNEDEWKKVGTYGDFNYVTNRKTMNDYWETRVRTNGEYENTYTLGLRGIHDYPMEGAETTSDRVRIMQEAIDNQREMLRRNIKTPLEEIPQVLCTYEEVLDAYHNGLDVPDDVTLLWSDDKHGYTRNLSDPEEMKRRGGAGIYYHLSYHGDPASWIWLSPLSPAFISTELTKAYTFGARKIWVFNVGDIKPAEKELSFAMDLAWNIDRWSPENAHRYIRHWAAKTFGADYADEISDIQTGYYRLQASGKDSHVYFVNYPDKELQQRIDKFRLLSLRAMSLMRSIPDRLRDAYFELVLYPVKGASMLNEYQLLSRRSLSRASYGQESGGMRDALRAMQMYRELNDWTDRYNNEVSDGKWRGFFDWHPYHWYKSQIMDAPVCTPQILDAVKKSPKAHFVKKSDVMTERGYELMAEEDCEIPLWINALSPVRNFSKASEDNVFCRISLSDSSFNASATPINNIWHASYIGPMWSKVGTLKLKRGCNRLKIFGLKEDARIDSIFLGVYPPFPKESIQVIPSWNYASKNDGSGRGRITKISQLGFNDALLVQPFDTESHDLSVLQEIPSVEYMLPLEEGYNEIEIRTLPTLHVYEGRDARYAVEFNGEKPVEYSIHTSDFSAEWRWNVLNGYSSRKMNVKVDRKGDYKLRFYFMDPGIVLQEIRVN